MMTIHDRLRNRLAALAMPTAADPNVSPAYLRGYAAGLDSARWAVDVDERVYVRAARLADLADAAGVNYTDCDPASIEYSDWTDSELRIADGNR